MHGSFEQQEIGCSSDGGVKREVSGIPIGSAPGLVLEPFHG